MTTQKASGRDLEPIVVCFIYEIMGQHQRSCPGWGDLDPVETSRKLRETPTRLIFFSNEDDEHFPY